MLIHPLKAPTSEVRASKTVTLTKAFNCDGSQAATVKG